jgi:hypothetical protein
MAVCNCRRPPKLSHHATSTTDHEVPRQHLQEGMRRQHNAAARTSELDLGFPPTLWVRWYMGSTMSSKKEWRHPQAPPHRCRTSRQGFPPNLTTTNPRDPWPRSPTRSIRKGGKVRQPLDAGQDRRKTARRARAQQGP